MAAVIPLPPEDRTRLRSVVGSPPPLTLSLGTICSVRWPVGLLYASANYFLFPLLHKLALFGFRRQALQISYPEIDASFPRPLSLLQSE